MNETLYTALTIILPLIVAIVFHEVAHGWMARALGDPTAHEQKRLSLNPLRHVDPIGTIVVPGLLWLTTHTALGWAKPVPVRKNRLRNPRFGMMAVAAAGPGINFVMAGLAAITLGLIFKQYGGLPMDGDAYYRTLETMSGPVAFAVANLMTFVLINIFLAFFNLLPIPPFDGSHIVEGLLPPPLDKAYASFHRFGMLLVILLIIVIPQFIPGFDIIGKFVVPPVGWIAGHYFALAQAVAGA